MSVRAKYLSRLGQAQLQEAVLDVLFHAYKKKSLGPNEISKRAGIHRGSIYGDNQNHIVAGILGYLAEQGRVQEARPRVKTAFGSRDSENRAWALSEDEYKERFAGLSDSSS